MKGVTWLLLILIIVAALQSILAEASVTLVKVKVEGAPGGVIPLIYVVYGKERPIWRDITTLPANVTVPVDRLRGLKEVEVKLITVPEYLTSPPRALYKLIDHWLVRLKVEVFKAPLEYKFSFKLVKKPLKVLVCPRAPV